MPESERLSESLCTLLILFTVCSHTYFLYHAGSTPDISRSAVTSSYQDFNRPVLSRLDVLCKVLVLRADKSGEKKDKAMFYQSAFLF